MYEVSLLIGGRHVQASNGRQFERRNPLTEQAVTRAAAASLEDADAAVAAAQAAFPVWAALGPNERRTRLLRAAELMASRADQFVAAGQG